MENKTYTISGLPFATFVVFLCMKLASVISWSWWIVTLPLWISPAILLAIVLIVFIIIFVELICVGIYTIFAWIIELFSK